MVPKSNVTEEEIFNFHSGNIFKIYLWSQRRKGDFILFLYYYLQNNINIVKARIRISKLCILKI